MLNLLVFVAALHVVELRSWPVLNEEAALGRTCLPGDAQGGVFDHVNIPGRRTIMHVHGDKLAASSSDASIGLCHFLGSGGANDAATEAGSTLAPSDCYDAQSLWTFVPQPDGRVLVTSRADGRILTDYNKGIANVDGSLLGAGSLKLKPAEE